MITFVILGLLMSIALTGPLLFMAAGSLYMRMPTWVTLTLMCMAAVTGFPFFIPAFFMVSIYYLLIVALPPMSGYRK